MKKEELARENHLFLVTRIPGCILGENFKEALEGESDDIRQCGLDGGYLGITAIAA